MASPPLVPVCYCAPFRVRAWVRGASVGPGCERGVSEGSRLLLTQPFDEAPTHRSSAAAAAPESIASAAFATPAANATSTSSSGES